MLERGPRFTLWGMMLAVAAVAVLLVVLQDLILTPLALAVFGLAWGALSWNMFRGRSRLASRTFLVGSLAASGAVGLLSSRVGGLGGSPWGDVGVNVGLYGCVPACLGAGIAWATAVTRREATGTVRPWLAWALVAVLGMAPAILIGTDWPLRLAFLVSEPALNRLADQAATGKAQIPAWAGVYRVTGLSVSRGVSVSLVINPNPGSRTAFVRLAPDWLPERVFGPLSHVGPVRGVGKGWWMQSDR
jgi:hypothetical protein